MTSSDDGSTLTRRDALLRIASALTRSGVHSVPVATMMVNLSEDSLAIIESFIASGYHGTPEAAVDAMRRRGC